MHMIRVSAVIAVAALAAGCSGIGNPSSSSPSVKKGELGNGGFTFQCDDSVACDRWNNADEFPDQIASGSTFELQFFLRDDSNLFNWLDDAERGTTIEPVGKFINRGASGFAGVHPGIATLSARDSKGWLVDYITVQVVQPSALVVYDADYTGDDPERIVSLTLEEGDQRSFRTVAQHAGQNLAGSIPVEWTSDDPSLVAVEGYTKGKVSIAAKGAGSTKLTAKGAKLEVIIDVTVTGGTTSQDAGSSDADVTADANAQDGGL